MPQPTGASRRKRGASARSETNGRRDITLTKPACLKGMKLQGPSVLPATFAWDLSEAQALSVQGEVFAGGALYKLLLSLIGADQSSVLREQIAQKNPRTSDGGMSLLDEVIGDIVNQYGTGPGES